MSVGLGSRYTTQSLEEARIKATYNAIADKQNKIGQLQQRAIQLEAKGANAEAMEQRAREIKIHAQSVKTEIIERRQVAEASKEAANKQINERKCELILGELNPTLAKLNQLKGYTEKLPKNKDQENAYSELVGLIKKANDLKEKTIPANADSLDGINGELTAIGINCNSLVSRIKVLPRN